MICSFTFLWKKTHSLVQPMHFPWNSSLPNMTPRSDQLERISNGRKNYTLAE